MDGLPGVNESVTIKDQFILHSDTYISQTAECVISSPETLKKRISTSEIFVFTDFAIQSAFRALIFILTHILLLLFVPKLIHDLHGNCFEHQH